MNEIIKCINGTSIDASNKILEEMLLHLQDIQDMWVNLFNVNFSHNIFTFIYVTENMYTKYLHAVGNIIYQIM